MALATAPILNIWQDAYIPDSGEQTIPAFRWEGWERDESRIENEIIVPILESEDIAATVLEKWPAFKGWLDSVAEAMADDAPCLSDLLQQQDAIEENLRVAFAEASERLGQKWVKALTSGLIFRKIVRESVLPHVDKWPEDSLEAISRRMALSDLCLICVLHHLATGAGPVSNVQTLAAWSFNYADYAYAEAGFGASDLGLGRKLEREE